MKRTILVLIFVMLSNLYISWSQTQLTISSDFEGGNVGTIAKVSYRHWAVAVEGEADSQNRNRQASWYYFKIDNAEDEELVIDLTNLTGEYNYKYGVRPISSENQPAISYDQENWAYLPKDQITYDENCGVLTMTFTPKKKQVWVAHIPPYTNTNLDHLLSLYKNHPMLTIGSIGETPKSRDMTILTITNDEISISKKNVIWIMARQHAWESGTSWVLEGLLHYLLDSKEGRAALNENLFKIIPMGDPDGVARGGVRFNSFGNDLNRNWDEVVPEEMPEIYMQKKAISEWQAKGNEINIFITLHNTLTDYVLGTDSAEGHDLVEAFSANSSFNSDTGLRDFRRKRDSIPQGRMSVIDALWFEKGISSYLIEMNVRYVKSINRRRTVDDWLNLGRSLGCTLKDLDFE